MGSVWLDANAKICEIERFMRDEISDNSHLSGLSPKHLHVLMALYADDKQHPSDLARYVNAPPTSFTPVLDILENRKLVTRSIDKEDRRAVYISLTVAGREIQSQVQRVWAATEREFGGK